MTTTRPDLNLASDPHVERTVLGALLLDGRAIADATERLDPDDFSLDSHRRIFRCVTEMLRKSYGVDTGTVISELRRRGELSSIGGMDYVLALIEGVPHNYSIDTYISILKDKAMLRGAMVAASESLEAAPGFGDDPRRLIEQTAARFHDLLESDSAMDIPSVGEWLHAQGEPEAIFETMAAVHGIPLGFAHLDGLMLGAQPGELIVIAGRPSMGKSSWGGNAGSHTALQEGKHTAVFLLEDKRKAFVRRQLASLARIDATDIRRGNLRGHERTLLLERRQMLMAAPLYIDDTTGQTCSRIRAKCSRMKRRSGLDIVIIDQLSHISMSDCKEREFRLRVGEQTKMLKRMARELDVAVVLLAQLKRIDGKGDPTPRLSDLKESGNIEEDADVVILLHRPEYYDRTDEALKGVGQMIVAKGRDLDTPTIQCQFNGRILRWEDTTTPAATQNSFDERTPW